MSIFSKVICDKICDGSIQDIYTRHRINLEAYPIQTQTPQFFDLGLSTINALDEGIGLSTPATKTQRPTYGAHWSMPNHIFGETTAVGVSGEKSDYDYNSKTKF